jgi:oxygen-independent coproporphyrinogen-3 oxidase
LQSIFDNCSVDIIYGLPNQSINSYTNTLRKLIDEQPDHFSSYSLQVERGTLLEKQVINKNLEVAGDELSATMYEKTMKLLKENGYEQYEISNWSLKGKRSLHNMKYWKLDPYIGIGPGAHSYINKKRFSIIKSPKKYIDFFGQKQNKKSINEKIQYLNNNGMLDLYENQIKKNHIIEYLMLRLRLSDGISKKEFSEYFGIDFDNSYYNKIKKYIENEILIKNSDRYYLSEKGKLFANEVAESFVE